VRLLDFILKRQHHSLSVAKRRVLLKRTKELLNEPPHAAPAPHCECGLYAYHSPASIKVLLLDEVIGQVEGWGNVEVHETGFRAQHMRVTSLGTPEIKLVQHCLAAVGLALLGLFFFFIAIPLALPLSPWLAISAWMVGYAFQVGSFLIIAHFVSIGRKRALIRFFSAQLGGVPLVPLETLHKDPYSDWLVF
jgi:hypothetical protein